MSDPFFCANVLLFEVIFEPVYMLFIRFPEPEVLLFNRHDVCAEQFTPVDLPLHVIVHPLDYALFEH